MKPRPVTFAVALVGMRAGKRYRLMGWNGASLGIVPADGDKQTAERFVMWVQPAAGTLSLWPEELPLDPMPAAWVLSNEWAEVKR